MTAVILGLAILLAGCLGQRSVVLPPKDVNAHHDPEWQVRQEPRPPHSSPSE